MEYELSTNDSRKFFRYHSTVQQIRILPEPLKRAAIVLHFRFDFATFFFSQEITYSVSDVAFLLATSVNSLHCRSGYLYAYSSMHARVTNSRATYRRRTLMV